MGKQKYAADDKKRLANEYYSSGLSSKNYAEKLGISRSSLFEWIKKYKTVSNSFIDVTSKVKKSIKTERTFTMSVNNKALTFSIL